jgi:murein DD-endopeptidase MepM/ murein hydrolase activator NlpD
MNPPPHANPPAPTLPNDAWRTLHPVIRLPGGYEVFDFTGGYDPNRVLTSPYGVGRYDERRPGMYTTELFGGLREWHMGVDLAAPVGEPIHAFADGTVHLFAYNAAPGDYGHTLVTAHVIEGTPVWALHGHLAARSLVGRRIGEPVRMGEVIAWVGDRHENGGWNPHLHFQLALEAPAVADLPGVVSADERAAALQRYPDPRVVLGHLW